jgi:nucleotide-binding universal stress UspA family protein
MLQTIKSVLVGVTEEGKAEPTSAFNYGLSLAQAANAHLTLQAATVKFIVPYTLMGDFAAGLVSAENRRIEALADAFVQRAGVSVGLAGVACTIENPRLNYSSLTESFLKLARIHDLCVLDAEENTLDIDRGLIEAILFESGRPVLIVPPGRDAFTSRRVMVAWDGSAAAARAVADAMPFLCEAEAVDVLSVIGEKDISRSVAGAELAPHLARHGAHVNVNDVAVAPGGDVAGAIREQARLFGADLIVAGAFKHSRLREWLLGGVTQSLLKSSPVPLLMSH